MRMDQTKDGEEALFFVLKDDRLKSESTANLLDHAGAIFCAAEWFRGNHCE
jgi:hypothetical protein